MHPSKIHVIIGFPFALDEVIWEIIRQDRFEEAFEAIVEEIGTIKANVVVLIEGGDEDDVEFLHQLVEDEGLEFLTEICHSGDTNGQHVVSRLSKFDFPKMARRLSYNT